MKYPYFLHFKKEETEAERNCINNPPKDIGGKWELEFEAVWCQGLCC